MAAVSIIKRGRRWELVPSPGMPFREFDSLIRKVLAQPDAPHRFTIGGEALSYADLVRPVARRLLWHRLP